MNWLSTSKMQSHTNLILPLLKKYLGEMQEELYSELIKVD